MTTGFSQTQFWSDTFETGSPTTGSTRTPEENGGTTPTPSISYFRLTDGSTVSQAVAFTGKEGTNYWAGEDHNGPGTGFTASGAQGAGTNDILDELQIDWTGINISGKTGLSFKCLLAANSTNEPWDNINPCVSTVGTTNTDYIIIEYSINGGAFVNLIRFYNKGSSSGTGLKYLFEDTDNNGCGDGTQLTNVFGEFAKTIPSTGTTLSLRIRVYSEGNNEEWGIDNFRLFETAATVVPTVTTTAATTVGAVKATLAGNVTADGGATVTERGVVWATTANPTTANTKVAIGTGTGVFSQLVTGLPAATLVHFRAYAINSAGTSYGTDLTFTTNAALSATSSGTNVSCNGGSNGSASVIASGGVASYTYVWSPSGGTGATATGLSANSYTCTITDNEGTQITKNVIVTQPSAIVLNAASQTNISCFGGSNGSASVIAATGGAGGYTYNWTPGNPTGDGTTSVTGLTAGTWTCTVTDANSCTATRAFTVTQPTAITSFIASQTNVSCNGGSNGSATVSVSGGTPGYTYTWSPSGGTASTASGLTSGTYTCTITDANSCTKTQSVTITQPAAVNNNVTQSAGVLTATQTGASYQWYQCPSTIIAGATNQTYTPTIAGDYKADITVSGCTVTSTCVTVTTLGSTDFEANAKFIIYPNPTRGVFNIETKEIVQIAIYDILGKQVFTQNVLEGNTIIDITKLPQGVYVLKTANVEGRTNSYKVIKE